MDPQRASYADDGTLICASCQGHSAAAAASHAARRGAAQEQVNTVLVAMIGVGALIAISGCCWISMLFRNSVH